MRAIKAVFREGQFILTEPAPSTGPVDVLIVFPEAVEDPWEAILQEKEIRPSFAEYMAKAEEEIAQGRAAPLDLNQL
jgi:hypothetical protein